MATDSRSGSSFGAVLLKAFLGILVGAVLLTVTGLLIPRTYTSSAILLFPGARSGGGGATTGDVAGPEAGGGGGAADQPSLPLMQGLLSVPQPGTSPATANLILRSRKVTTGLIAQFGLDKEWGLPMEEAMREFNQRFVCGKGATSDLTISYRDNDPKRAREIVRTAIKELTHSVEELSLDPASRNLAFLRSNLAEAERDCAQAEKELVEFQRGIGGTPPDAQVQALGQTYSETEKNLITAEIEERAARSNLASTTTLGEKMIKNALDPTNNKDALLTTLYRAVVDRETELEVLRQQYTDKRSEVVKAKQALEVARGRLKAEIDRQLTSMESGASPYVRDVATTALTAKAKVEGLRQAVAEVKSRLETLPAASVKYGELTMNLKDCRTRLQLVRSEYVKAQLIAQSRGPQFVILDQPNLPRKANGYDLIYFTLFGAVAGLGLVLLAELFSGLKRAMKSMGL